MNIEDFRTYCLKQKKVTESFPFDDKTLVFKIGNKIFALAGIINFNYVNLKCDPERSIELRETYNGVKPAWHMSKKHWNSVYIDSDVPIELFLELVDHSFNLVCKSLPKRIKNEL